MGRRKTPAIPVPTTEAEAQKLVAEIAQIDRDVARIKAAHNKVVENLKTTAALKIKLLNITAAGKFVALHSYVEVHRAELMPKKKKSVKWPAGTVGFRVNPISVKFKKADEESIIERLKKLRSMWPSECIRIKASLDKAALVDHRKKLPKDLPVTFEQVEQFYLRPADAFDAEHAVQIDRQIVTGDEK